MALVGEAHIIVRAITSKVDRDIRNGFKNVGGIGHNAGNNLGKSFSRGFNQGFDRNIFQRVAQGIKTLSPGADEARIKFHNLVREGYTLGTALSVLVGGISSVLGGLVSLGGAAAGAIPALAALGNVVVAIGLGMRVAKLALGGVGKAVSAITKANSGGGGSGGVAAAAAARAAAAKQVEDAEKSLARVIQNNRDALVDANNNVRDAQLSLNEALKAGREEIQQLGFDAEDAALSEAKASLDLDDARRALAAVQDLPPNSRARKEAELAYQEADLNLRKAKDASADLNAEQDRLAKTGVRGTKVVINATEALAEAQAAKAKTVRDALQSQADAMENLSDAQKNAAKAGDSGSAGGGGGGADPFAGLNQAQIDFARFIASLKPKFDELKLIAANGFLPPLTKAIQLLVDRAFPTVAFGVDVIAKAMGSAVVSIAEAIVTTENLAKLTTVFSSSGVIITGLGKIIGSVWGILLSILVATAPLAEHFIAFLEAKAGAFDAFLDTDAGKTKLTDFFTTAERLMKDFGTIFGNIFGGFGAIIAANTGPGSGGDNLLTWLKNATGDFAKMGDTAEGKGNLKDYFQGVASNTQKIFSSVGALLGELIKLGSNKAIGETFDALKKGAPAFGEMMKKAVEAGPAMADLVNRVTDIFNRLTDTGAIKIFFDTLSNIAKVIQGILDNPVLMAFLTWTGRVAAALAAFGLVGKIVQFAVKALLGSIRLLLIPLGGVSGALTILRTAFTLAFGPVGIIITIIAALVASLIFFFTQTEIGKEIWANVTKFMGEAWENFSKAFMDTLRFIGEMFSNIWQGIQIAATLYIQLIIAIILGTLQFLHDAWEAIWNGIVGVFTTVWEAIVGFVTVYIQTVWQIIQTTVTVIQDTWNSIWTAISTFVSDIWNAIVGYVQNAISGVRTIIDNVVNIIRAIWEGNWGAIGGYLKNIWDAIVGLVQNQINFVLSVVRSVGQVIGSVWNAIWKGIGDFFTGIWNTIVGAVQGVGKIFHDAFEGIAGFVRGAFEGVLGAVKGPLNGIIGIVNNAIKALNKLKVTIPDWVPLVGGQTFGLNLPTIPSLAKGATVMPRSGGSLVRVAEAGRAERIEPLDKQGLSERDRAIIRLLSEGSGQAPIQIIVNPSPGMDETELAAKIDRIIAFRMRKGAA